MNAIIRLYPVSDPIQQNDLIKVDDKLEIVDFVYDRSVGTIGFSIYDIDEVQKHKFFAINKRKAVEVDKRFYGTIKDGDKVKTLLKTIYEKPFIGEPCLLIKQCCNVAPKAVKPVAAVITNIEGSTYTLTLSDKEEVNVKRHYFKLTTRNNYKELAWILKEQ